MCVIARFQFQLEESLYTACCKDSVHELLKTKISKERISIELKYMLTHSDYERAILLLTSTSLLNNILCIPKEIKYIDNEIRIRGVTSLILLSTCIEMSKSYSKVVFTLFSSLNSNENLLRREQR
jgi:tRNA nucleotidyltransferase/poly(A) polymerase